MCKSCKMDPGETARFRLRQGAVPIEDFDEEPRYRHPKRHKKKEKKPRPTGCPENNNGAHVYVWVPEDEHPFYKVYGWHKSERQVCCGCGKTGKKRETEQYEKIKSRKYTALYGNGEHQPRGEPVATRWRRRSDKQYKPSYWYWAWENLDPVYVEEYNKYIERLGFPSWRRIRSELF